MPSFKIEANPTFENNSIAKTFFSGAINSHVLWRGKFDTIKIWINIVLHFVECSNIWHNFTWYKELILQYLIIFTWFRCRNICFRSINVCEKLTFLWTHITHYNLVITQELEQKVNRMKIPTYLHIHSSIHPVECKKIPKVNGKIAKPSFKRIYTFSNFQS